MAKSIISSKFLCYVLCSPSSNRTYVGITNNLHRRLRQHNGEILGGAKATRGKGPWNVAMTIHGFQDKVQVMQFEWAVKHSRSKKGRTGAERRLSQIVDVTNRERWTSKSPLSSDIPLTIKYHLDRDVVPRRTDIRLREHVEELEEEAETEVSDSEETVTEENNGRSDNDIEEGGETDSSVVEEVITVMKTRKPSRKSRAADVVELDGSDDDVASRRRKQRTSTDPTTITTTTRKRRIRTRSQTTSNEP